MKALPALLTVLLLTLPPALAAGAASLDDARAAYAAGALDGAERTLEEILDSGDAAARRAALALLAEIAVDRRDWTAARDRLRRLAEAHPESPEAADARSRLPLLEALVACGCAGAEPAAAVADAPAAPPSQAAPPAPPEPAPAAREPGSEAAHAGRLLVGGWGDPYDSSQKATAALVDFLAGQGVAVALVSTDAAAVRGEDVVLSYLLEEARQGGADGILFVVTRFGYREVVRVEAYDPAGRSLWREKVSGGLAIKPRVNRGEVNRSLVDRMTERLGRRVGTPDLPTAQ